MALRRPDTAKPSQQEQRHATRDASQLLKELNAEQAPIRRWAARDLGNSPETAEHLLAALEHEPDDSVREALFCSLEQIAHGEASLDVSASITGGLIALLRSESVELRNEAIELLQSLPQQVAPHLDKLLADHDPDVRIFALDILRALPHPKAPEWINQVLTQETHVNVLGAAVDRATEWGTPEMQPALENLLSRLDLPTYLYFAIRIALERMDTPSNDKDESHG